MTFVVPRQHEIPPPDEGQPDPQLRNYMRTLRRRKTVVLLATFLVAGASFAASHLQSPTYRATAKVLLQPRSTDSLFNQMAPAQRVDPERALQTEIQVLKSEPVRELVRSRIRSDASIAARSVGSTDVIAVSAESRDPKQAAHIANAYATAYVEFRRKQAVDDLLAAGQEIQAKVGDLEKQIDGLDEQAANAALQGADGDREAVSEQKEALIQQQALFKQRLDQLQVDAALKSGGAQLVASASPPTSPVEPRPVRNALLGVLFGLMLGVGLALLREYLDDSLKNKDDLERAVPRLPVIGLIPVDVEWKDKTTPRLASVLHQRSPVAEAFRTLRTTIQFVTLHRRVRTLQVTSPSAGDGKSTTVANLGVAFARAGRRVVIVDCDLRRPRMSDFFGLPTDVGITSVLLGEVTVPDALQPVPGVTSLSVLTSGPLPHNPAELLNSAAVDDVFAAIDADVVLIDAPPILPITDALVLAPRVDATLLVCLVRSTPRKQAVRAVEMLQQVNAPVLGAVLNGVRTDDDAYGYSYSRYYASQVDRNGHEKADAAHTLRALPTNSEGRGDAPVEVVASALPAAPLASVGARKGSTGGTEAKNTDDPPPAGPPVGGPPPAEPPPAAPPPAAPPPESALTAARRHSTEQVAGARRARRRHPWRTATLLLLGLAIVLVTLAGLQVRRSARSGEALLEAGTRSLRRGDHVAAARQLAAADRALLAADARLARWPLRPLARVPLVDRQVRAAHALLRSGSRLAAVAAGMSADVNPEAVRLRQGALDTTAVARLEQPLEAAVRELRQAQADVSAARAPLLLPMLGQRLAHLDVQLRAGVEHGETAVLAARVVPALFGSEGARRYFLAIPTPVELRGSGGMIGSFGELTTSEGRLRLDRLGRTRELNLGGQGDRLLSGPPDYMGRYGRFEPARTWQNVTMSPDFPSVARVIGELYPQSGGQPIDGVLSVDPVGLTALLKLTGPVRVPEWPEPLTATNAGDILLRQQYERYDRIEREEFLASTARAVFDRLTSGSLPAPAAVGAALAPAIRGRHLMLFSTRKDEQRLFERLGAAGAMPPIRGDFVGAVIQDASASKIDLFLERSLRYRANFDPATGRVQAEAVVELQNRAPSSGLPSNLIGGGNGPTGPGENRLYLSLYSPLAFKNAELDGRPLLLESERELGRNVYSTFITIPPGQSATLRVTLSGSVPAGPDYRLDVASQPAVDTGELDVEVHVQGRRLVSSRGLQVQGQVARARMPLVAHRSFEVHLNRR